jgi:FMN phosphatase YigB (HAD superfamily)
MMHTGEQRPVGDIVIFDQDKTLYEPCALNDAVFGRTRTWLCSIATPPISEQDYEARILRPYPEFRKGLAAMGMTIEMWWRHIQDPLAEEVPSLLPPDSALAPHLRQLNAKKLLVTLSSPTFSRSVLETLGVADCFAKTFHPADGNKGTAYDLILAQEGADPSRILVVGDDYLADLRPAQERGMRTALICRQTRTPEVDVHHVASNIHELLAMLLHASGVSQ